jgi:transcriptional regulator with XRE-family HTH domain
MKTLGERIRERREELDLSLREFAKQVGCSPPFISDVEHGRRFPSELVLELMAQVLKLKLDELQKLDPRPPMEELKKMAESDPAYAFAFRIMVANKPGAADLLRFVTARSKGKQGPQKK